MRLVVDGIAIVVRCWISVFFFVVVVVAGLLSLLFVVVVVVGLLFVVGADKRMSSAANSTPKINYVCSLRESTQNHE